MYIFTFYKRPAHHPQTLNEIWKHISFWDLWFQGHKHCCLTHTDQVTSHTSLWKCSWIHECSIHSSVHHPQGVNSDTRMHESSLSRTTVAQLLCIYYFHCTFLFHVATDTTGKLLCNSLLIFLSLQSALLSLLSVHCKCFNIVQPDMQMGTRQKAFY